MSTNPTTRPDTALCLDGGERHRLRNTGLNVNSDGELVDTRKCRACGSRQENPYGTHRGWRAAR